MGQTIPLEDLYTPDQLAAKYPRVLTKPALDWQLRHRDTNGLSAACVRIGKRILISHSRYECWLATRAGAEA